MSQRHNLSKTSFPFCPSYIVTENLLKCVDEDLETASNGGLRIYVYIYI